MGWLWRLRLWTPSTSSQPKPDPWQLELRRRASLCHQINTNLATTGWQLSCKKSKAAKPSRLRNAATLVLLNAKESVKLWTPSPLKTFCLNLRQRLLAPLIIRCWQLRQRLKHRLVAWLLRSLIPPLYKKLLVRCLTPWIRSPKCGLAMKPSKPGVTSKPLPSTNQPWLSNLATASLWCKILSRWF